MRKLIILLIAPFAAAAQDNSSQLKEFMSGQHEFFRFNGNAMVIWNGKIIYEQSLGYADYNSKRELNDSSIFELASISKQFTAMGIMICKEKGLLRYEDNIKKFFPSLPYDNITIRNLLTHTSGVPAYEDQFEKNWDHKKIAFNKDIIDMLQKLHDTLYFQPGSKWRYSNTGYALLASVIEKVSGMTYNEFMTTNVFGPLGMTHTFIYNTRRTTGTIPANYALGFVYSDSLKRYILPDSIARYDMVYYLDGIVGDGCVNTTVGDLFKWDKALYENKLVSKPSLDEMLSPQVQISPRDSTNYYGFGVFVELSANRGKIISHTGSWPGYATDITRMVDSGQTIILLSNNGTNPSLLVAGIQSILAGEPLLMPYEHKEVKIDPAILDRYVGKYYAFMTLAFVKKDGHLYRHRDGTPDIELKPESDTKFFYGDGTDRQIEFEVDPAGKVTRAWFINSGQKGELKKLE